MLQLFDSDVGSMMCTQPVIYQDPVVENKVSSNAADVLDSKIPDLVQGVPVNKSVHVAGYPLSTQADQFQQPHLQFVQMGNPGSYYPSYSTMLHHQPIQYVSNQPYPIYVMPVGQSQGYIAPQYYSKEATPVVSGRPPLHPNTSINSQQVVYKEVADVPPIPGFVSQVYRTSPIANSPVQVPYNESKQQNVVDLRMHNQSVSGGVTSRENADYSNESDDETARAQIYKSQPPPPSLPSQYQTMTNATTLFLSEALAQMQMDNIKQPIKNSQQQ